MEHLAHTPISSAQIKVWTDTDKILSRVKHWIQEGWPEEVPESGDKEVVVCIDYCLYFGLGCMQSFGANNVSEVRYRLEHECTLLSFQLHSG